MSQVLTLPHGRLTRFAAAQHGPKPALILCPGGGYEFCSIREGAPAARAPFLFSYLFSWSPTSMGYCRM